VALANRTLADLVELLAAREPAPGGGSAAAWTGAIAAALTEMAAAFALSSRPDGDGDFDRERVAQLRDQAARLRACLLELAEQDTRSYAPVLEALALARSDPSRPARVQAALSAAAEVPLAIAAAAADVGELAVAAAKAGNMHLIGDATAAAVLAEASARAAVRLAELNLIGSPRDPRLEHGGALAERAWAARTATLALGERPRS
jgi:formiminotetrahydrofolate cyclodeaminase